MSNTVYADLNEGEQYVRAESGRASWKLVPKRLADDLGGEVEPSDDLRGDVETQHLELTNESAEPTDTQEGTQHDIENSSIAANILQESDGARKLATEGSVEQDTEQEKEIVEQATKQEEEDSAGQAAEGEGHEHHAAKMDDVTAGDVGEDNGTLANDNLAKVEAEEKPTIEDNPLENKPVEGHSNDNKPIESNGSGSEAKPISEDMKVVDNTNGGEGNMKTIDIEEKEDGNSQKGEAPEQSKNEQATADGEVKKEAEQDSL